MTSRWLTNVALAPLTTFGVAGRARFFLAVETSEQLLTAVNLARERHLSYRLIAGGSNVVLTNRVLPGLTIRYLAPRSRVERCKQTLICSAGLPLARLIKISLDAGLAGLETLSGIPGTVGGAIVGNAGAYGQCISDHLTRVEIFNPQLGRSWWLKKQCGFFYRGSIFKRNNHLILRAEFKLKLDDKKKLFAKAQEIIKIRSKKYQSGLRCPGSFFKNVLVKDVSAAVLRKINQAKIIEGKIPAGYLLEQIGANGLKFGGLHVADYHGNLIVNDGHATYREVRALATKLKKLVKAKFGITLEEEVRYIH